VCVCFRFARVRQLPQGAHIIYLQLFVLIRFSRDIRSGVRGVGVVGFISWRGATASHAVSNPRSGESPRPPSPSNARAPSCRYVQVRF